MSENSKQQTILVESLAITIHDHIRDLQADASMQSYRRWVWELLQNAIDLSLDDQECRIKFIASNDSVEFQHNGKLFNDFSMNHLFLKKSTKRDKTDQERVIGNFGTGFLTTHLLSKIISLSGVYQKADDTFIQFDDFLLNREGDFHQISDNILQFMKNHNILENSTNNCEYNPVESSNTRFVYKIHHPLQITAARLGMEDLENCLPYCLIFISQLKQIQKLHIQMIDEITTIDQDQIKTEQMEEEIIKGKKNQKSKLTNFEFNFKTINFNSLNLHTIVVKKEIINHEVTIFEIHTNSIQICLNVKAKLDNKKPHFKIQDRQSQLANWFAVFPLIGTEAINFPFIVNSFDFIPTKERNGLILFGPDIERVDVNKNLMVEVVQLSKKFVEQIVIDIQQKKSQWSNLHLLANIQLPDNKKEYIDIEWYSEKILEDYRMFLFSQPLVLTDDGYKPLKNIKLPFNRDESKTLMFAQLCRRIFKDDIPVEKVMMKWLRMFEKEEHLWPVNLIKFSLQHMTEHISKAKGGFESFMWNFKNNEQKGYSLLNDLIHIIEEDQPSLLNDFPILPNQLGQFRKPSELFIDDQIPELFKDLMINITSKDLRCVLLDIKIINVNGFAKTKGIVDIETELFKIFDVKLKKEQQVPFGHAIFYLNIVNTKQSKEKTTEQRQFLEQIKVIYPTMVQIDEWGGEQYFKDYKLQRLIISFAVNHILETIDSNKNTNKLLKTFNNFKDESQLKDWIFEFINLLNKNKYYQFKDGLSLFPNKYGDFITYEDVIVDNQINKNTLAIYNEITKYNQDYLQKEFSNFGLLLIKDQKLDINLIRNKFNFSMPKTLDNYGVLAEILKVLDNYNVCMRWYLYTKQGSDIRNQKRNLLTFGMEMVIKLAKSINLFQIIKDENQFKRVFQVSTKISQDIYDLWISYHSTTLEEYQTEEIFNINFLNDVQLKGFDKLYELILFEMIIQLHQEERIHNDQNDRILLIINQVLNISFSLKLPDDTFENNKIIPNQQNIFKSLSEIESDYNDITQHYGSPQKLKLMFDSLKQIKLGGHTPTSVFAKLANQQIQSDQIKKQFKTSVMLQYIDQIIATDRVSIKKQEMMNLYCVLEDLCNDNIGYKEHLRSFCNLKLSIFSEFFQDERNNEMMFELMNSGQLQNALTLQKCLLDRGAQPNKIIFNNFKEEIFQAFYDQGIQVTMEQHQELILINELQLHICFIFTYKYSHVLTNDHLVYIQQQMGKKLELVIVFIDKSQDRPIQNSKCIRNYNAILIKQFGKNFENMKQSLDYDLQYSEGIEWGSYLEQLNQQISA